MRIIGGQFKGRSLKVPASKETRPTMDRTREAVFNMLNNAPFAKKADGTSSMRGAVVLDVFAGSGAYGLEALSHGASHVSFMEYSPQAVDSIQQNIYKMDVSDRCALLHTDVLKVIPARGTSADIAFFDPPYSQGMMDKSLKVLASKGWINADTLLVIEMAAKQPDDMPALNILDQRQYGKATVLFARLND